MAFRGNFKKEPTFTPEQAEMAATTSYAERERLDMSQVEYAVHLGLKRGEYISYLENRRFIQAGRRTIHTVLKSVEVANV